MFKLSVKPAWVGAVVLVVVLAAAIRLAMAITAFTPASQPIGHVAQDEMTNFNLKLGTEVLFRGQYELEFWGGDLVAYAVNSEGDIAAATKPWQGGGSAHQLEQQGSDRRIVTLHTDGSKIPFAWGNLSSAQQTSLGTEPILDYLRGVRSGEKQQGGTLRQRASPLGAIVHSRPFFVSDGYKTNVTETSTKPTIFVGANDGMLHAFDARTGEERWAYVPSMLIPKLKGLTVDPYVRDYYVDGSVNVAEILGGSKRVLVGGLGAGGKGLYALDITGRARLAPTDEAAAASNILWEITPTAINSGGSTAASTSYANLGFTYSNPTLAKMLVSSTSTDVVIVGNGYNNGGDFQAYLFVINANTGALISAIKAGTAGTAGSPNGLSTPAAVDNNGDGNVDIVYAGDLNGTMWKFTLSGTPAATPLLTTAPAQPITMTPGVALHPNGGFMVNFATGAMLTPADATDTTSVFAAYGVWDGAPAVNTTTAPDYTGHLVAQTLTERCYTAGVTAAATPCASRVYTVTSNAPDYTPFVSGLPHHNGWRVPLPTGHKVVGDGSFIENGRFYFTVHNPNASTTVSTSTVKGESWLLELDYLSGGTKNVPFLDLSGNHVLDNDDRVKDLATPPAPVMTTDGIPVGKFISIGVLSQPILVQLSTLNNTLFNQNPDITFVPAVVDTSSGVTGGHFDEDIYYGSISGGAQASATITVGTSGQTAGFPATLGAITVGGATIVPALTVVDLANGTASGTNAAAIAAKITGGYTASVSGSVITILAPAGANFNGKTISIAAGSSQTLVNAVAGVTAVTGVTGVAPTAGTLVISDVTSNSSNVSVKCGATYVTGAPGDIASVNSGVKATRLDDLFTKISGKTVNGYATTCSKVGAPTGSLNCSIAAPVGVSACASFTLSQISSTTNTGPAGGVNAVTAVTGVTAVPKSGWTNFAPALTATVFNNSGADPTSIGDACTDAAKTGTTACRSKKHFHQYDDEFDVTGVNMLNPSSTTLDIKLAIPSLTLPFKVIAQNQYLSPAAKLHIGDPSYLFNVDFGYVKLKDYTTSATLSLADLQTYQRDPNTVWPAAAVTAAEKLAQPKAIGSLTMNLPVDGLSNRNWYGNGDVRAGLHPTVTGCVNKAVGANDGNMYQPVIPPANGTDGPGLPGWSSVVPTTTPATATGVRHNGALVIQIIRHTTPDTAIEQSVPGRPEYGWRVKSANQAAYVLAEYSTFWHHPNGKCYSTAGWTKAPGPDTGTHTTSAKAPGSTDPKIGELGVGGIGGVSGSGSITSVTTTTSGAVTTTVILYSDNSRATIVRTSNADGTVTIVTTDAKGNVTQQNIASSEGGLRSGGDERGLQARIGRISWRELVAP